VTAYVPTSPPRRGRWQRRARALAIVVALAPASHVAAQVTYTGSLRTATGTYLFTERTTSVYFLSAVDAEKGRFRMSGSVPLIYQSTPWLSYGTVPIPSGGKQSGSVAEQIRQGRAGSSGTSGSGSGSGSTSGSGAGAGSGPAGLMAQTVPSGSAIVILPIETVVGRTGVGDPTLRASYRVTSPYSNTVVRLHGAYKPGLASVEEGFGTGASDYGAGTTVAHLIGRHQFSGSFEAWSLGDMPDMTLNTTLSYRVAYDAYLRSNLWSVSGAFAGWTTVQDGVEPPRDLSVGVARYFGASRRSLGATASFGLSDSSPDVAVSLDWRVQF